MMGKYSNRFVYSILLILGFVESPVFGQSGESHISGTIAIDSSWERTVYLSYIPTFDQLYSMSEEMIITRAAIDSLGNFSMETDFLPERLMLYRMHLVKKGDSPGSLIIGGNKENHFFLLAGRSTLLKVNADTAQPPFARLRFAGSTVNEQFYQVTQLVKNTHELASVSTVAKRNFLLDKLQDELMEVADSCRQPLVALYALYQLGFEEGFSEHREAYRSFLKKWKGRKDSYFSAFRKQIGSGERGKRLLAGGGLAIFLLGMGYFLGRHEKNRKNSLSKLSLQERRVFEMLREGASNQEISEKCNIGLSTVKSHVSSIYSKLNLKSRKEVMDYKI